MFKIGDLVTHKDPRIKPENMAKGVVMAVEGTGVGVNWGAGEEWRARGMTWNDETDFVWHDEDGLMTFFNHNDVMKDNLTSDD